MATFEETPTSGVIQRRRFQADGSIVIANEASLGLLPSFDNEYYLGRFGICTQHDSLFEACTARQHLELYLSIRLGSKWNPADWQTYIDKSLKLVSLDDAGSKCTSEYSGGMKRKLQAAISMHTGANLIVHDEISTGVDAHARRCLWKSMHESLIDKTRAIVLVSHAMEEVEAVSSRVTIMRAGELCCFGSTQHLKSKFGGGYAMTIFFNEPVLKEKEIQLDDAKRVADDKIRQKLANCTIEVAEKTNGPTRVYTMANPPSISAIFNTLAALKDELNLESYSVAQTSSLDTIFLKFAGERATADE